MTREGKFGKLFTIVTLIEKLNSIVIRIIEINVVEIL